jgi:hypothetical protein
VASTVKKMSPLELNTHNVSNRTRLANGTPPQKLVEEHAGLQLLCRMLYLPVIVEETDSWPVKLKNGAIDCMLSSFDH